MHCKSIPILNHSSTVLRFPMKGKCFYYKGGGPGRGGGREKKSRAGADVCGVCEVIYKDPTEERFIGNPRERKAKERPRNLC